MIDSPLWVVTNAGFITAGALLFLGLVILLPGLHEGSILALFAVLAVLYVWGSWSSAGFPDHRKIAPLTS